MTTLFLCLSLLIAAVQFSTVDSALPCNSPLRKYLPDQFTHCASCSYGQWSPWRRSSTPPQVIANQTCATGKAKRYERSRTALPGSTCTPATQTQDKYECVPTLRQKAELIIQALRLGADADRGATTGQPSPPGTVRPTTSPKRVTVSRTSFRASFRRLRPPTTYRRVQPRPSSINYCPTASQQASNRICPNICPRGKRSLQKKEEITFIKPSEQQILEAAVPVEPFNMEERVNAIHERRRRQTCPNHKDMRYVLFIVDTSGSIGATTFNKVRDLLASISEKLCDQLRVAMMTYSSDINLEFCFNCHTDRRDIFNAIRRVRYRGGWTHTTDATKCACDTLLTPECGLPDGRTTPNIDIVYLTDGKHNGPCRSNLANEVNCFHNQRNINTYAIAIGNATLATVEALENPHDTGDSHVFNVDDFDELEKVFELIQLVLNIPGPDGKPIYTCFSHDGACRK